MKKEFKILIINLNYFIIKNFRFILLEYYSKNKKLPIFWLKIASIMRISLFWIFDDKHKCLKKIKPSQLNQIKFAEPQKQNDDEIKPKKKCKFCNRCDNCECELKKEKEIKDKEKEFQLDLSAINYFAFIIMFLFVFTCNVTIWYLTGDYQ